MIIKDNIPVVPLRVGAKDDDSIMFDQIVNRMHCHKLDPMSDERNVDAVNRIRMTLRRMHLEDEGL